MADETNPNASYDVYPLSVDPPALDASGSRVRDKAVSIVEQLDALAKTFENLKLNWVGATASKAQEFNNDWHRVMTTLIGTKQSPEDGVLNVVGSYIKEAASVFSETEVTIKGSFDQFAAALAEAPDPNETTPTERPADVGYDWRATSVAERYD